MQKTMKTMTLVVEESGKEYTLYIGRNQKENDMLVRTSGADDLWFHLENISGPHFVLQSHGDVIPKRDLNWIASLFPQFKNKLSQRYKVIYTEIKNVTPTKTAGQVLTTNTRIIRI
jgi:predicted ribosome quality control (RQC) complex YloA/Tae2 family protein